jgi:hypothetical protein
MKHILGYEYFNNGFVEIYEMVDDVMRIDNEPVVTGPRYWGGFFFADRKITEDFIEINDFIIKRESGVSVEGTAYIQKITEDRGKFRHDFIGSGALKEVPA